MSIAAAAAAGAITAGVGDVAQHGPVGAGVTGLLVTVLVWLATVAWWVPRASVRSRARRGPRLRSREVEPTVHLTVVLDLLRAALGSGSGVPHALGAVGRSVGGEDGAGMEQAGAALLLGATWERAWDGAPSRLDPVADALRPSWVHGAAPADALRVAGEQLAHGERSRARAGAARLGVRLVLPLGLCLLPAFVLLGLVPVMVALGTGLGAGLGPGGSGG